MSFLKAEFGPGFALGDPGIDVFFDDSGADATYGLDTLAIIIEAVGCDGLGVVFVCGDGLGGKGRRIIEVFVVGPVWAAKK